ncbi:MAG: dethiobiotin synthase [Bacteroidia bacterium]|nr:dethiobiotin synthase [Bacteroidia bacterium]
MHSVIVTGIHTDVGKTRVAAVLTAGLGWQYWKPVQTGSPADRAYIAGFGLPTLPERYHLALPAAPLVAAEAEGITLSWDVLKAPPPSPNLIIEGAGGLFVPLTYEHFLIDLFAWWKLPLLLVVRPYLGAMNHTWLSVEAMERRGMPFLGVVLNGTAGDPSEAYFRRMFPVLGEVPWEPEMDPKELFHRSGLAETVPLALERIESERR